MALADEIAVKLGLSTTQFKQALKEAGADIAKFKKGAANPSGFDAFFGDIAKRLTNMKTLSSTVATAIGLNFQSIAENVARLITGVSKEEEEALKKLGDVSEQVADANIAAMRAGLTEEKKYQLALVERESILKRIAGESGATAVSQLKIKEQELKLAQNSLIIEQHKLVVMKEQKDTLMDRVARNEKEAQDQKALLDIFTRRRFLISEIKSIEAVGVDKDEVQREIDKNMLISRRNQLEAVNAEIKKRSADDEKDQYEFSVLQFKSKQGLSAEEKKRYETLKIISKELKLQVDIDDLLSKNATEKLTPAENRRLLTLQNQVIVLEKQKGIINQVAAKVEDIKKTEQEITAEKEKQLLAEKNRLASIAGVRGGNQFNDASDATLQEVSRRNRNRAQVIQGGSEGSGLAQNLEIARLLAEALNAEKELEFRREFKQSVSVLGEGGARARFGGDPLQFDRVLSQFTEKQDKATNLLQSLDDRLNAVGFGRR